MIPLWSRCIRITVVSFVFVLCIYTSCADTSPIVIGFSGLLSGRNSQLAIDNRNSFELAVAEQNMRGGVMGRQIKVIFADDGNSVEQGVSEDEKMIDQGANVIVGHFQSSMIPAMRKVMAERDVLYLTPVMSAVELKGIDDMVIRTIPSLDEQSTELAHEVVTRGFKTTASIYDTSNKLYAYGIAKNYSENLKAKGLRVFEPIEMDLQQESYSELADKLLQTKADVFLLSTNGMDAALLAQQIRKKNNSVLLIGPSWAHTEDLLVNGGKAVEGMLFSVNYSVDDQSPTMQVFRDAYQAKYGSSPGYGTAVSYDTAKALFEAIEKSADLKPKSIKESFLKIGNFKGIVGDFTLDRFGDAHKAIGLYAVKNGAYEKLR